MIRVVIKICGLTLLRKSCRCNDALVNSVTIRGIFLKLWVPNGYRRKNEKRRIFCDDGNYIDTTRKREIAGVGFEPTTFGL